jgi:hypothetical protein
MSWWTILPRVNNKTRLHGSHVYSNTLVTKRSEIRSEGKGDRVARKGLDNIGKILTISISFLHKYISNVLVSPESWIHMKLQPHCTNNAQASFLTPHLKTLPKQQPPHLHYCIITSQSIFESNCEPSVFFLLTFCNDLSATLSNPPLLATGNAAPSVVKFLLFVM